MPKSVAMLRGINVSGQKKILMKDLSAMFEALGCKEVKTYIQSGNVVYENKKLTAAKIQEAIMKTFGFDVPVIIKETADLKYAIEENPYRSDADEGNLYITFMDREPDPELIPKLKTTLTDDEFTIVRDIVFLYVKKGYGETKLNNNLFESKLKVKATTRNWKTVNVLYEMMA